MRSKTVKRLAILIGVLGLIGAFVFYRQSEQIARNAREVSDRAKEAEKDKNFALAERLLKERLEVFPDHTETQIQYADILANTLKVQERREQASGFTTEF